MTRKSVKMVVAAVACHPATPWLQWLVGLAAFTVSLYLLVIERDSDKAHLFTYVGIGVVALLVLPGVFTYIVENARRAIEVYRAFRAVGKEPPTS